MDDFVTAQLLRDVYTVSFARRDHNRMRTSDLLEELYRIEESPWGDWYGQPISAHALTRLVEPYRNKTMPVKDAGGETVSRLPARTGFRRVRATCDTKGYHRYLRGAEPSGK